MKLNLNHVLAVASLSAVAFAGSNIDQCGLYMAVSSTSTVDDTNWGLFAGKAIPLKTAIGYPEIGINVPHLRAHSVSSQDGETKMEYMEQITSFFETFFWVAETIGAKFELQSGRAVAAIPGAGVLGSYNDKLTNAEWNVSAAYHRTLQGEVTGDPHPGRGASSHFYSSHIMSTKEIAAGSEIFLEFGESWKDQNGEDEQDTIAPEDYERIDRTVEQLLGFFETHKESLDETSRNEVYKFVVNDILKAAVGDAKARKISQILPTNAEDLHKVRDAGGAVKYGAPGVYRKLDWLQEFGLCLDNIRPGVSTIPNAGRGAFATRKIKEGGFVAPVPLIHFADSSLLNTYVLNGDATKDYTRESNEVIGRQLLENYCFGHPQSTMIFFPAGSTVPLINHSKEPNVKLVWSNHPSHQRHWLDINPIDLTEEDYQFAGLLMELVAIRDIEPDEEIFIDYGSEWQDAWDKHVELWNLKIREGQIPSTWPTKALDLNDKYSRVPFETQEELQEPYPENVSLKAFLMLVDTTNEGTVEDPKIWDANEDSGAFHHDNLFSVVVIGRVKLDDEAKTIPYEYTVRWDGGNGNTKFISKVPHEALVFVDRPGTSDQFTSEPFRHIIEIPDEIFPQGPWRNIA